MCGCATVQQKEIVLKATPMTNKKKQPQRRSLNDRITAAIEDNKNTQVAGITTEPMAETNTAATADKNTPEATGQGREPIRTKKATTIMPKEVFNALQRYCTENDTPKHRAIYLFILEGLRNTATITDDDYKRFVDMAAILTPTYEKK